MSTRPGTNTAEQGSTATKLPGISHPPDMPIPNVVNVLLVVLVVSGAVALLWLASSLESWWAIFAVGIGFSYLLLTNYALLHEATHLNLHHSPKWNYWLGVATGMFFPVPFTMILLTHQGHHDRNRTDAEMFDLYYETDNWLYKCWIWYGTLAGGFWPLVPIGALLVGLLPRPLYVYLFRQPPWRNPSLDGITSRQLWRLRGELLLIVAGFALMFWLLGLKWSSVLILYACFSFNWSTRQYVGHAFSQRDVIEGAWNLRHNRLMATILLNGNWDLNHHRHPEAPWYYLPGLSPEDEERPSYVTQYWRQWLGPQLTTEPPPASVDHQLSPGHQCPDA